MCDGKGLWYMLWYVYVEAMWPIAGHADGPKADVRAHKVYFLHFGVLFGPSWVQQRGVLP